MVNGLAGFSLICKRFNDRFCVFHFHRIEMYLIPRHLKRWRLLQNYGHSFYKKGNASWRHSSGRKEPKKDLFPVSFTFGRTFFDTLVISPSRYHLTIA